MSIFNGNIFHNIALVPAYRDALYFVEERNKGETDGRTGGKRRERGRVGENAIWEEFASSRIAAFAVEDLSRLGQVEMGAIFVNS